MSGYEIFIEYTLSDGTTVAETVYLECTDDSPNLAGDLSDYQYIYNGETEDELVEIEAFVHQYGGSSTIIISLKPGVILNTSEENIKQQISNQFRNNQHPDD